MAPDQETFDDDCVKAASRFLQTMIVVDDEAEFGKISTFPEVTDLATPGRTDAQMASGISDEGGEVRSKPLDAQALIEAAMAKGIVCSVLQTRRDSQNTNEITEAAQHADIICLDWEIDKDDGERARELIYGILESDAKQNGRMRLIAIYTAVPDQGKVLQKILDEMPIELKKAVGLLLEGRSIKGNSGIRIVYFRKDSGGERGTGELEQTPVADLPKHLIKEFASISPGILSNIALATIASIRRSTHHTVMRYDKGMDGPYLAHRGKIGNFHDSIGHGVEITLADLTTYIDRDDVEAEFAGKEPIDRRLMSKLSKTGLSKTDKDGVLEFVCGEGSKPKKDELKKLQDSTFCLTGTDKEKIEEVCNHFNNLTVVSKHPGNIPKDKPVELGLGTIVRRNDGKFFLCVQPACDSVRIQEAGSFAFLPLSECNTTNTEPPNYVVKLPENGESKRLKITKRAHTQIKSWSFKADEQRKRVFSVLDSQTNLRVFKELWPENSEGNDESKNGEKDRSPYTLTWICELKRSRANRDVQVFVANKLGRIGVDEFELHRLRLD